MATQVLEPRPTLAVEQAGELAVILRRHFLFESYAEMAQRAGVAPEFVEGGFRELYGSGIRVKRLAVRRAYIAREPRQHDTEIGRQLGISRKQVVEIRSQLRLDGHYRGRKRTVPTRENLARRAQREAYIREHYETCTKQQIAQELGVSEETIRLDFHRLQRRGLVQPLSRCRLELVAAQPHKAERQLAAELGISVYGVRFIKRRLRELRGEMNLLRCQVEREIRERYAPATGNYVIECMREALNVLDLPQQRVLLENTPRFKDGELQPIFWHLVRTDMQGRAKMIRKIEAGIFDLKELERTN
jgi:DNA-binding CsgD family transcriptional regulator